MLKEPTIDQQLLIDTVSKEYGIGIVEIHFLPLGADTNTAVYLVSADNGEKYFAKLRLGGFEETSVTVPYFLYGHGIKNVIPPIASKSSKLWSSISRSTLVLYPYVQGMDAFETELGDSDKIELGMILKGIHTVTIGKSISRKINKETFSAYYRNRLKELLEISQPKEYSNVTAQKLVKLMKSKTSVLEDLISKADSLVKQINISQTESEFVLCHADFHAANLLIDSKRKVYIVDWDTVILAPKERDLMFVGGGIDKIWETEKDMELFYEGYGKTAINYSLMAYYRMERVIEDLVAYALEIFSTARVRTDRGLLLQEFESNFLPGQEIEIAFKTLPV